MPTIKRDSLPFLLLTPIAYGAKRLHTMALDGLRRAGVGPWFDPLVLPPLFGRDVRHVTGLAEHARLVGRCVEVRHEPGAGERCNGLNAFWADALILFQDAGDEHPSTAALQGMIGFLGLSDPGASPELEARSQRFLPLAFIRDHQRRRRFGESGLYAAIPVGPRTT